jgi:S-DNA-T family DNA segregation ATPase FtsK/SpoIIIE
MAKKSDKQQKDADSKKSTIGDSTLTVIYGIVCIVISLFLVLAYAEVGGKLGTWVMSMGLLLFGSAGYLILPLSFFMLGVAFLKRIKQAYSYIQIIGILIFLGSSLGLIDVFSPKAGGLIGVGIGSTLIKLVDIYATVIFLLAGVAISLLLVFEGGIPFPRLFFRKKEEGETGEEDVKIVTPLPLKIDKPEVAAAQDKDITPKVQKEQKPTKSSDEIPLTRFLGTGKPYIPPPLSLLQSDKGKPEVGDIKANANIIKRTLQNFGITVEMDEVSIGPSVTRYALKPAEGVKLARIVALQNDLSLALAAHPLRIEAPIPGKSLVGIEIPNRVKTTVGSGTLLADDEFRDSDKPLLMSLGRGISGKAQFTNLAKAPHLLIAGATGSGKSVTIHALLTSLLYRNGPEQMKMILIDPKRVELTLYNNIPHLLTPVITDPKRAIMALKWAAKEMDRRYNILEEKKVRDIDSYHKNVLMPELDRRKRSGAKEDEEPVETMPYIIFVIDELADIMQSYPRELEAGIVRLAQMSRAVGIHLMLSTQRPSVNVITGLIKANVPSRIALQVASQIDSRTILDQAGAEKLLGAGDMLFMSGEMSKPMRIQSAYISETEVKKIVQYLVDNYEGQGGLPVDMSPEAIMDKDAIFESSFEDDGQEDELYQEARRIVIASQQASVSALQRRLSIGFSRAGKLIDMLERKGVVGPGRGSKPREVLVKADGVTAADPGTNEADTDSDTDEGNN